MVVVLVEADGHACVSDDPLMIGPGGFGDDNVAGVELLDEVESCSECAGSRQSLDGGNAVVFNDACIFAEN